MKDGAPHVRDNRRVQRLARVVAALGSRIDGKRVATQDTVALLEAAIAPGERVCLEGNNQKQADFLAESLASCDATKVHDLHLVQSVLALPSHMDLFERGIARRVDFSFSGRRRHASRASSNRARSRSARSIPTSSSSAATSSTSRRTCA